MTQGYEIWHKCKFLPYALHCFTSWIRIYNGRILFQIRQKKRKFSKFEEIRSAFIFFYTEILFSKFNYQVNSYRVINILTWFLYSKLKIKKNKIYSNDVILVFSLLHTEWKSVQIRTRNNSNLVCSEAF